MIKNPEEIEKKSFEIIYNEIKKLNINNNYLPTVMRVIHTTADFEYADILEFHNEPIKHGRNAIKSGCRIYADTNMIAAGINRNLLTKFNCELYTLIKDNNVIEEAKARGITRSIVGMEKAACDPGTKIFIIGNAPTALFTLKDLIFKKKSSPSLVIGVPVGFVGAYESKIEFLKSKSPCIITKSKKGGSTVAVAVFNSILYSTDLP